MLTTEALLQRTERVGDCLIWQGAKSRRGYGCTWDGQRNWPTHRLVYVLEHGPIDRRAVVMHSCDTPSCINPAHLSAGTPAENMRDALAKGRFISPRGERNGAARLTAEQAAEIKASPQGSRLLARRFGVGRSTVRDIRHGKTWRAVRAGGPPS